MDDRSRQRADGRSTPDGADTPLQLVEAKLAVPSVRSEVVDRPRIRQTLDTSAALTLVAAPAGYGKTTAVRAWCENVGSALAWVTLDGGDNDPVSLWRYVATAVDLVRPGLGRGALQRLRVPDTPIEDVVDELMNGVAAFGSPLLLALDDLHEVTNDECLASIDHALAHVPPNARVFLLTRADPALSLGRLRAARALAELRADELAFSAAEAHELLVVRGRVELGREEIRLLVERTEGWPAALVLASIWLQAVDDPGSAVRSFGGDHRFVAEYLSDEVLASLDDDRRSFLLGAAALGEFTADLCDSVLDRTDSAAILEELEHVNFLVSRLERGSWFRMHALMAEYARAQLALQDSAAAQRIQRRAAQWLRSRRLLIEAVAHADAAGEDELVAELLVEIHLPLIRSGDGRTLLRWVRRLPDDIVSGQPALAIAAAVAVLIDSGSTVEQRRFLRLADRGRGATPALLDPYVETVAVLARALMIDQGVAQAVLDGRRAIELAETGPEEVISAALTASARALFFAGESGQASAVALRALEYPFAPSLTHARTTLALIAVEQGRLAVARRHAEAAREAVGRIGGGRSWLGANAAAAIGMVLAAEGHDVEAEHELAGAERFFRDEVPTLHEAWLLLVLARVRVHRGRLDEAEVTLRSARQILAELGDSGWVPALADEVADELQSALASARDGDVLEPPSEAELAVLRLLDSDLSAREIGEQLFLSHNTIRSHKRALYRKLGVHSRPDAIARATALGLLKHTESPG